MNFLERWFPDRPQGHGVTNGAVTYYTDPAGKPEQEHLVLNLRELTKQEPITAGMEEFAKHLARWEHYNDNRKFLSGYGLPDYPC